MTAPILQLSDYELAHVSVAVVGVDGVLRFGHREQVPCYAASIMKLAVAVAVLRDLDRGLLSPGDVLFYDGGFASSFDGSRFVIDDDSVDHELFVDGCAGGGSAGGGCAGGGSGLEAGGSGVSVARALRRSITVSSNEGANLLMQAVGLEAVNQVLREAGCENSVVGRMVFDIAARDAGYTNVLTALDAARVMWSIRFGAIAAGDSLVYLTSVLRDQTQRSMVPFALRDALERGDVVVGNKEGQTNEVLHDVAFIEPKDSDPFVVAVCTSGLHELEATLAVRKVATYAYENRGLWNSVLGGAA